MIDTREKIRLMKPKKKKVSSRFREPNPFKRQKIMHPHHFIQFTICYLNYFHTKGFYHFENASKKFMNIEISRHGINNWLRDYTEFIDLWPRKFLKFEPLTFLPPRNVHLKGVPHLEYIVKNPDGLILGLYYCKSRLGKERLHQKFDDLFEFLYMS